MRRIVSLAILGLAALAPRMSRGEEYRLEYQTVYDEEQVTAYRIETETVCEEKQVTTYRPVCETEMRERRYTVAKPVTETSEREERYKVLKPVMETEEREQRHIVRRQVCETAERDEVSTVLEPVTTYQTNYVDQGCYEDQQLVHPGPVRNRLKWLPGGCFVDPATGATVQQRAGFAWVAEQGPASVTVQRVWKPNVVAQQIPKTNYVQKVVTRKVPVQVSRFVDEEVVQRVPVQVCKMVEEEHVNRIPVTTTRMEYEERVEQVPVTVQKMVAQQDTIRVPRVVEKRTPIQYTRKVPHTVVMKIPVNDSCSPSPTCCESTGTVSSGSSTTGSTIHSLDPYSKGPTRAKSGNSSANSKSNGTSKKSGQDADKKPAIDPNEKLPGPVDYDDATSGSRNKPKADAFEDEL